LRRSFIVDFVSARVLAAVVFSLLVGQIALAQEAAPAAQSEKSPEQKSGTAKPIAAKPAFKLTVKREPLLNISLKADKAKLTEIAESLAKQLKTTVLVAPALEQQLVTMEFDELTLEPAMQLLAPEVYIDYEIKTSHSESPKTLGVYFYPANQEPPVTAVVQGSNQSLLIEGDTEEGEEPSTDEERRRQEEQPLKIQFKDNILSVRAKKQPLQFVLLKIGEELGIPVEIQADTPEVIDAALNKVTVEDAMRQLSPNITLFVRADLAHAERRALKIVLVSTQTALPGVTKESAKPN